MVHLSNSELYRTKNDLKILEEEKKPEKKKKKGQLRVVTQSELRGHSDRGDAWIAIRGKVYDITEYAKRHPGGSIILRSAGKDGTNQFGKKPKIPL